MENKGLYVVVIDDRNSIPNERDAKEDLYHSDGIMRET
jgi:hypothetical protein